MEALLSVYVRQHCLLGLSVHPRDSCQDFTELLHIDLRVDLVKPFLQYLVVLLLITLLLYTDCPREDVHRSLLREDRLSAFLCLLQCAL